MLQRIVTALSGLIALSVFLWPLFISSPNLDQALLAQTVFIVLMPTLLIVLISSHSSGVLDSRQIAVLAVLVALNSLVRMLGAGLGGVETSFFLIVIGGYVFRASFGLVLGAGSMLVSALLTGGMGPWLPFQMMAAGLVGLGAGTLPRPGVRWLQVSIMCAFSIVAAYIYGALMTLWNWPFFAGTGTDVSYLPGGGVTVNLARFITFEVASGGLLWDTGRAVTTVVLLTLTAPTLLTTLERVARRAGVIEPAV